MSRKEFVRAVAVADDPPPKASFTLEAILDFQRSQSLAQKGDDKAARPSTQRRRPNYDNSRRQLLKLQLGRTP